MATAVDTRFGRIVTGSIQTHPKVTPFPVPEEVRTGRVAVPNHLLFMALDLSWAHFVRALVAKPRTAERLRESKPPKNSNLDQPFYLHIESGGWRATFRKDPKHDWLVARALMLPERIYIEAENYPRGGELPLTDGQLVTTNFLHSIAIKEQGDYLINLTRRGPQVEQYGSCVRGHWQLTLYRNPTDPTATVLPIVKPEPNRARELDWAVCEQRAVEVIETMLMPAFAIEPEADLA